MTTRRRRAGSDSNPFDISEQQPEEVQEQPQNSTINPLLLSASTNSFPSLGKSQAPVLSNLSWGSGGNQVPSAKQEAYYKKTDVAPPTINSSHHPVPRIFTPSSPHNQNGSSNSYSANPGNFSNQSSSQASSFYTAIGEGISNYLGNSNTNNNHNNSNSGGFQSPSYYGNSLNNYSCSVDGSGADVLGSRDFEGGISSLDPATMASRDRTSEFAGIIRSQQQGRHGLSNGSARGPASKEARDITQYSHFMKRSRMVGRNISSTYAKLEKLTLLARKRSLFDDSQDVEVQELTAIIRHDLGSLTKQLEDLKRNSSSSSSSTAHMQKHSANLVGSLQTKVAGITQMFRDVLEVRTVNLKKQAERREQFTGGGRGESAPLLTNGAAGGGPRTASVLLADEAKAVAARRNKVAGGDVVLDFDGVSSSSGGGSVVPYQQQQQQQLMILEEQDSLLQSRAETMKTIETTIVELGTMFTQLAAMVKEQDELVHRIDANVDDADMNVEAAHSELLKYFRSVSSNRWLMLKVFGIVVFFFIIFVVFMA